MRRFFRPDAGRLAARDPWERLPWSPPLAAFGPGAQAEFSTYLEGPSRIDASTPMEMAEWLLTCRYADDPTLLGEHDAWQHPATFELIRSGDCEDYSLWAWRKLVEARIEAEFVVGLQHRPDGSMGRHAWVHYVMDSREFVFDGVQPGVPSIIRPLEEVRGVYTPQVGATLERRFVFAGLFRSEWGRRLRLDRHR